MARTTMHGIDDKSWGHLLDSLEEEKCIVCVGPGVYSQDPKTRTEAQLSDFLRAKEEEIRIRVYEDGWFHYLPDASEIDAWQRVKEFYQQPNERAATYLEQLSQIPFYFLLNFIPSYALRDTFANQGFAHEFLSYIKKEPYDPDLDANKYQPNRNKPLIYNMVGEVKKRNSLVMTYDDFYNYLESIFEGNSMSPVLKENIWEADYFIFLGMPFDRWYVHMFMRILQQHEKNRSSKKYAANVYLSNEITTHCAEQYTMTFVPDGIGEFLQRFHDKCKERGILRSAQEMKKLELSYDQIIEWLRENKFEEIFDELIMKLTAIGGAGERWKTEVLQLDGRFNDLKRSIRMGVIDDRDRIIEMNRIRANILDVVESMRKALTSSSS